MKKSTSASSAFTLIELLVVITIIAILAGIALPVFTSVQEKARATQDLNNLKQIGIGMVAYLNDNNDTLFNSSASFAKQLNPQYINVWKTFQSPFDTRTPSESDSSGPIPISYDFNMNLASSSSSPKSSSDVVSPSNCITIAPLVSKPYPNLAFSGLTSTTPSLNKSSNTGASTSLGGTFAKGKRINVLMFDAHAESMLMSDFHSSLQNTDATTNSTVSDLRWNSR